MYKTRVGITSVLFICLSKYDLYLLNKSTAVEDSWFCLVLHWEVSMKLLTNFSEY